MNKKFNKIFVISFVALTAFSLLAAAADPGPKQVGSSKVFIAQNWSFDFGEQLPPTFSFKTFGFPTTPAQTSRMEATGYPYTEKTDSLGNLLLDFSFQPRQRYENVSLRAFIDVDYSKSAPSQSPPAFLSGGPLSEATPETSAKARQVADGGKTVLEKIALLTNWVHNRVKYDGFGYGSTIKNASWTYENKVGTCDEYSHLLISMLRSVNIPAKFVAGFVCSADCEKNPNWGLHAWVEAYANGAWVPSDPTFNEALLLDATHVKFAEGKDQDDIKEQLSVVGFNFPINNVKVQRSTEVSLDEWKPFKQFFQLSLAVPEKTVGENSIEKITAAAASRASSAIAVPLSLVVPKEVEVRGEQDVLIYLEPGETRNFSWNAVFPPELKEGFVYNFTVDVLTLGEGARKSILAKKGGDTRVLESLRVKEFTPELTEGGLLLKIDLENSGNRRVDGARVRVESLGKNESQTISLDAGEVRKVEYLLPAAEGASSVSGTLYITLEGKETKQPFNIDLTHPTAAPTNLPNDGKGKQNFLAGLSSEELVLFSAVGVVLILAFALFMMGKKS